MVCSTALWGQGLGPPCWSPYLPCLEDRGLYQLFARQKKEERKEIKKALQKTVAFNVEYVRVFVCLCMYMCVHMIR